MEKELVHFHIFDPRGPQLFRASANDRSKAFFIYCENKDNCSLYKNGYCIERAFMCYDKCPYGSQSCKTGYTKRASKLSTWIKSLEERYGEAGTLSYPPKKMAIVGDYIYLPYSHINRNSQLPFLSVTSGFSGGNRLMLMSNFTITTINAIINHHPHSLFGGEIKDYQQEEVPLFIVHLNECFPDLYKKAVEKFGIRDAKTVSNKGRKIKLNSAAIGSVFYEKGHQFKWNGEYLSCDESDYRLYSPVKDYDHVEVKVYPSDKTTVEITDDSQVCETTVFID